MSNRISTIVAFAAVVLTAFGFWYSQRPAAPQQAGWEDVLAEADRGGYEIITTEDLAERYLGNRTDLLLIDTRQEWEYRTGHIDGALNFPMEPTWWARWSKADELQQFLGPDKDQLLVFY